MTIPTSTENSHDKGYKGDTGGRRGHARSRRDDTGTRRSKKIETLIQKNIFLQIFNFTVSLIYTTKLVGDIVGPGASSHIGREVKNKQFKVFWLSMA